MAEPEQDLSAVLGQLVEQGIATPDQAELARAKLDDPEVRKMIGFMAVLLASESGALEITEGGRTERIEVEVGEDGSKVVAVISDDGKLSPDVASFAASLDSSEDIVPPEWEA